jgi:hypothetical protein
LISRLLQDIRTQSTTTLIRLTTLSFALKNVESAHSPFSHTRVVVLLVAEVATAISLHEVASILAAAEEAQSAVEEPRLPRRREMPIKRLPPTRAVPVLFTKPSIACVS